MYKIPKYINKPLQFLGLEMIEVVLIYVAIFFAWIARSGFYLVILVSAASVFIHKKKKSPQGFYKHILYYFGFYKLDFYPAFSEQEFLE